MARTKNSTRTSHTAVASSSRPQGTRGGRYQPQFDTEKEMLTYLELMKKKVGTMYHPDEPTLMAAEPTLRDEVMHLIRRGWWQHLFFGIQEPTFKEVTCEVLATIELPKLIPERDYLKRGIRFQAFEDKLDTSLSQIERYLGFDDVEVGQRDEVGLCDLPPHVNRQAFWESISRGGKTYKPRETPATLLYPRKFRVIHALLASTVTGRAEVGAKVSTTDLLCLYCMVHDRKPCMGSIIASLFHRQSTNHIQALYSGPYITRLLRRMDYGDQFRNMEVSSSFLPLTILPSMNTGLGARLQREADRAAAGGGGQQVDDDADDDDHDDDDDDVEMEAASHEAPYDAPPYGTDFPDSWAGMHAHQDAVYRQLSTEQHERFDQMRFEQQDFYREMREDQTLHYSQLQSQYTRIDERLTSMESSWSSFFDDYPPPPPPEF
ncbi:unnamed protein product [Cuscuta epithymum]|uniref:Uncharacterized protein n=2 Tax=Cuscuta epithymum TaxID=186058 RepID=A0AAV0CLE6_9ASTE|nr:unnamed protein product [Cuscuta epithymum]